MTGSNNIIPFDDFPILTGILWKIRWIDTDMNILLSGLPKFALPVDEYYLIKKWNYLDFLLDIYYSEFDTSDNKF